ncbi:MAG TPA: glycosyltransferase family 2 protein, partial [Flavobacteriales bacterium]|nr:glycosyltransferase family 2 protein [Flavobacteriales bacterium]
MQSGHKVSVIIVNFRVKDVLRDCLLSLRSHAVSGMEVLIVDNASHDGSVEMVRAEFPEFQLIASNSNMGFSPANNVGMDACTGDLILLLNPDTIVEPGALQHWVDLHSVTKAGISGPKLLNADGSLQVSA